MNDARNTGITNRLPKPLLGVILLLCLLIGAGLLYRPPAASTTSSPTDGNEGQASLLAKGQAQAQAPTPLPHPTATPDIAALQRQAAGNPPSTSAYYYAPETSHSVTTFADVFNQFGAVHGLGLPLTEPFVEARASENKAYWVQYFEKAVIEYHPELQGSNQYQLTALGAALFQEKYPNGPPQAKALPGTPGTAGSASQVFPETKHTVRGAFLTRWTAGGGLARFGYPISETFEEVSDADGQPYIVQYFERAEMQYHPKEKAPQDVQLVALGALRLSQLYPNGAPYNASQAIPSPTVNATATAQVLNAIAQQTQVAVANAQATVDTEHANATNTAVALEDAQVLAQDNADATRTAIALQAAPGPFIPYPGNGGGPTPCKDGTWSHSSGRGTCSHHGGIKH